MSILNIQALTKQYTQHQGLFSFDLSLEAGMRVLLLGPNGAGKTTAFKSILGLHKIDSGQVIVANRSWEEAPLDAIRQIGAMVAKPAFYGYLTAYQNLNLLAKAYADVRPEDIERALASVELSKYANQKVSTFSSGMLQRLDLAKAIMHKPKVLLLDEPFNGVDIEVKHSLKNLLLRLQQEASLGILLSSHMAADLEGFATDVVILYEGKTLYRGSLEAIKATGVSLEEFYLEKVSHYKGQEVRYVSA